jgi:hypothetical protein
MTFFSAFLHFVLRLKDSNVALFRQVSVSTFTACGLKTWPQMISRHTQRSRITEINQVNKPGSAYNGVNICTKAVEITTSYCKI